MKTPRFLAASVAAALMSSCSSPPPVDVDLIGKVYSTLPTSCFAGLDKALLEITGNLYNQRKPTREHPLSTLPMTCEAEFATQGTEPGPAQRLIQASYWLYKGTGSDRSDIELAQRNYNNIRGGVPERDRVPLPDNLNGLSWQPGHSAILDGNVIVQFVVTGKDRSEVTTNMPPETARANAATLAEAQLRNCSPIKRC